LNPSFLVSFAHHQTSGGHSVKAPNLKLTLASGILALAVGGTAQTVAAAGPPGETSGPAAGTKTTPGAAVHKQASNPNDGTSAGAPGASGKQGSESGDKPAKGRSTAH
jgi:hypothetical protein